jgi:1-phosphofructokinase/tagatose 6-phosphate kinase
MIITVTLNTAIDKTLAVPNFRLGRRHRTVDQTTMPGGKGVNVARVLKTLGQPVIATGLAGGPTGTRIVDQLTQLSVLSDFVRIREESRTNTAVIDPTTAEQTEINERGPAVSQPEIDMFADKLLYLAQGASVCVFAGSLPRQVEVDVYARLIPELRRLGVTTVVDTDGDPLRRAVRAEPDVVSPNVLEAEELVGHEFNDDEDHLIAVREMVELGAREAIMTAPDGCYALMAPQEPGVGGSPPVPALFRVRAPALEPRATIGSGDAFLAGFVAARYQGRRRRSACATASPSARSRRSTWAPASSIPRGSSGCSTRSRSSARSFPPPSADRRAYDAEARFPAGAGARFDRTARPPPKAVRGRGSSSAPTPRIPLWK